MTASVKVGAAWKDVPAVSVNVGGTWKSVVGAWVNVADLWFPFFTTAAITLNLIDRTRYKTSVAPTDAYAGVGYLVTGNEYYCTATTGTFLDTGSNWISTGDPTSLHIKCTVNSGDTPAGATTGSWLAMTSDKYWYLAATSDGDSKTCNLTIAFSDDGGSSTLDSCTVVLLAWSESSS
jgi:hypothetical protein